MSARLSSKSIAVAEHIRDRVPFTTHGAMQAEAVDGLSVWNSGQLSGVDLDRFRQEASLIDYVVYSYATPIAWHTSQDVGWYRVKSKFSVTTSRHQGRLYLIPDPR